MLWDIWHKHAAIAVTEGKELPNCLVMEHDTGNAIRISHFQAYVRSELAERLDDPEELAFVTSYSFRRAMPTLADHLQLAWTRRVAAGGWTEAVGTPGEKASRMPHRYSGAKREEQAHTKRFCQSLFMHIYKECESPVEWSDFRAWLSSADQRAWASRMDQSIGQDVARDHDIEVA